MRPPHTQIIIFHNEPPFHSCIYYIVIDDEYQKFKLITNQFLKFRFVDILLYVRDSVGQTGIGFIEVFAYTPYLRGVHHTHISGDHNYQ